MAHPARLACTILAALAFVGGCGGRTRLHQPRPVDGGPAPDGGVDAGRPDGLEVACGRRERFTTPGLPITLEATATSPEGITAQGWSLVAAPAGSTARNAPTDGPTTTLDPDLVGAYLLRFEAADGLGRTAGCEVRVQAIVGPPAAICPEEDLRTGAGVPLTIYGDAFDDVGVVSVGWSQVAGPAPARLTPVGGMGAIVELLAEVPGRYGLRLTAVDRDGSSDSCDVVVLVTAPPTVACPGEPVRAPTRRPVTVSASATDDGPIARTTWELVARPEGSAASPSPVEGSTSTTITPDRRGEYRLRFTAFDGEGLSASCEVVVIGTPTPPEASCPAVVETAPLTEVSITASAVDDGRIVRFGWRLVTSPPGARPAPPSPADSETTRFRPDLAGEYLLRVTVADDDGMTDECDTVVRAISGDGLRVEVFWDTDGTDMDTHLLRPGARAWADDQDDCHFRNCVGGGLSWGGAGADDDPRLDIDDTNGFGPENINIRRPAPGRYRVGVHAWAGFARITVRIYCGGSTTEPRRTFGPVALDGRRYWRVADVDIGGAGCTITDLAGAGGPSILEESRAEAGPP